MPILFSRFFRLFAVLCLSAVADVGVAADQWRFKVSLDGDEIGYHNFSVNRNGAEETVSIEAKFAVKFLLVTAYTYDHKNTEIWRDGCLQSITSNTDDNGDLFWVNGIRQGEQFAVKSNEGNATLDGCVTTFAYWNPAFLKQARLLNSQNGRYLPVTIQSKGRETLTVRGQSVQADAYTVAGDGFDTIELWYTPEGEWLRLASTTAKGYRITYDLL